MIDVLYLAHNRLEFTKASFETLLGNTNWGLVRRLVVYDDDSEDGTYEYLRDKDISNLWNPDWYVRSGIWGDPVAIMLDYLADDPADMFAKIDNDTVVPPFWLESCLAVMRVCPELSLLGIEPPESRRLKEPTRDEERRPGPFRWVECGSIGGLGVMRTAAFEKHPDMQVLGNKRGFFDWQRRHTDIKRGWIAPALSVFVLDRMIIEPWASLSREYIAKGWQRPWSNYRAEDSFLWDWWTQQCAA